MTGDRESLQSWYRDAMLRRIDELLAVREGVEAGSEKACETLRKVGQSLRGSGATFGFPELSTAGRLVESTSDAEAPRRLEGLLVELRRLAGDRRDEGRRTYEWLFRCAGDSVSEEAVLRTSGMTVGQAWTAVADAVGSDEPELARRVAQHFDLEVARLTERSRSAHRLVPEAFMAAQGIVPVTEDSATITVATCSPVSLGTEYELRKLTGRTPVFTVAAPAAIRQLLAETDASSEEVWEHSGAGVESSGAAAGLSGVGSRRSAAGSRSAAGPGGGARAPEPPGSDEDTPADAVLVVDDERSARLLIRTLLEKRGFSAVEAADGVEALEVMRSRDDIGLAVVDLKMPEMDGLELIWELRDVQRWSHLPVIVVTGEQDEMLETQVMEEGADDYIRKPVDPRLFLARVEATLRRAQHASATG